MATTDRHAPTAHVSCPDCAGRVRASGTERICADCGLVVATDRLDRGPDWRDADGKHAEAAPAFLGDRGLGTELGFERERDADTDRRARLNARAKQRKTDRNRAYATTEIQRIAGALGVADDRARQAKHLFRRIHDTESARGMDLDVLAATCLYTVLRQHQCGRTTDEVAAVARCAERPIARRHRWVCNEMGVLVPPPDPRTRLRVVAGKLGASHRTKRQAERALERVLSDASGSPSATVAAVLYAVGEWTQATVADAAGVTDTTVRQHWKALPLDGQTTVAEFGVAV